MKSLDYLKLARDRGLVGTENCSTVYWLLKVADKEQDDFFKAVREEGNFTASEMLYFITKLNDVVPADVIEMWIRKVSADPSAASILAVFALRWKEGDSRKKIFFEEFVKTFADAPHEYLSQIMFGAGANE